MEIFLSPAPRYRAAAAYALGQLGRTEGIPVLMRTVQDFENVVEVRYWSARALGELCGAEHVVELSKIAENYPEVHTGRALMTAAGMAQTVRDRTQHEILFKKGCSGMRNH